MGRQASPRIVDIATDPNGAYIGRDGAFNLYWFVASLGWVLIKPELYGEEMVQ